MKSRQSRSQSKLVSNASKEMNPWWQLAFISYSQRNVHFILCNPKDHPCVCCDLHVQRLSGIPLHLWTFQA